MRSDLLFFLKASRPGFWLTAIWFYLLPLAQHPVIDSFAFWLGLVFITFPLGLLIYGWNDIMDANNDRLNERKGCWLFGPRGTDEQLRKLPWVISAVHLPFLLLFLILQGRGMLGWYFAAVAATAIYNWPRRGCKGLPLLDLVNQLGYLLVFSLSSMLNQVPELQWPALVFGALFAMHSHLLSEILDLKPDRLAGRRTTALLIGPAPAKYLVSGLLFAEAIIVGFLLHNMEIAIFFACGTLWFLVDALWVFREASYPRRFVRWSFLAWNVIVLGGLCYWN